LVRTYWSRHGYCLRLVDRSVPEIYAFRTTKSMAGVHFPGRLYSPKISQAFRSPCVPFHLGENWWCLYGDRSTKHTQKGGKQYDGKVIDSGLMQRFSAKRPETLHGWMEGQVRSGVMRLSCLSGGACLPACRAPAPNRSAGDQ
jgi:hypothetical protein